MNSNQVAKYRFKLRVWQFGLLAAIFFVWWALTKPGLIPAFVFDNDNQAAFFFGEPLVIFSRIWDWFVVNADIYAHLWTTLVETILAFAFGTISGGLVGMWLALTPFAAAVADPFIKGLNSMPRVILAPIFAVWFGLGIASKVALGVTLVFFIVFFNVYQARWSIRGGSLCAYSSAASTSAKAVYRRGISGNVVIGPHPQYNPPAPP